MHMSFCWFCHAATQICIDSVNKYRPIQHGQHCNNVEPSPRGKGKLDIYRSKAVLLLSFLTVACCCCPYLYFGSPIM